MSATVGVLDVYGPASPPRSNGELVFAEPWESRAFGLALALHAAGAFDWEDFRQELIATIAGWPDPELVTDPVAPATEDVTSSDLVAVPWSYYHCWLAALESVLAAGGLVSAAEIDHRAMGLARRPAGHDHGDHSHG